MKKPRQPRQATTAETTAQTQRASQNHGNHGRGASYAHMCGRVRVMYTHAPARPGAHFCRGCRGVKWFQILTPFFAVVFAVVLKILPWFTEVTQ
jgi:hypothetical protein